MDHGRELAIINNYVDRMPTFSPATAKIIQLTNNLNASANEIMVAIRLDPILTGKVLQLVNSAYFSLAQKVTNLNRALVYLGINTIRNLALSTAVLQTLDMQNKELAEVVRPAWRHSLATAVCSKMIAKVANVPKNNIEEYFIAGLLHDIGKIVLIQAFYRSIRYESGISPAEERFRYGVNHNELGASILKKWRFSDDLVDAVGAHHSPKRENKISYFLHVADAMTYQLGLNAGGDGKAPEKAVVVPLLAEDAWTVLGVSEEAVKAELQSAEEQIEKAEIFLNITSSKEKVVEKE